MSFLEIIGIVVALVIGAFIVDAVYRNMRKPF
jgi:hypothetical protein